MERVNRIWCNHKYQEYLQLIAEFEADRRFCKHDIGHMLDVARIMIILNHRNGCRISEDIIYATALLHDIGRALQYKDGIGHEEAGGKIAPAILKQAGFMEPESEQIVTAIVSHRERERISPLGELLYDADKLSRTCFSCNVQSECYWSDKKKNLQIKI